MIPAQSSLGKAMGGLNAVSKRRRRLLPQNPAFSPPDPLRA